MIKAPQSFIGRQDELRTLKNLMAADQPTSVNIVAARRMGKSSLLYHFFQTWKERLPPEQQASYGVIYLSLQAAGCTQESGFYQAVADKLLACPEVKRPRSRGLFGQPPAPGAGFQEGPLDRIRFAVAVRQCRESGVLPVLCLDEFEQLFAHRSQFDDGFYDSLRDLMNDCALMLIMASRRMLDEYRGEHRLTSAFFNLGQCVQLRGFTPQEAQQLVGLPRSGPPALSPEFQAMALKWGKGHPFLLQMAAQKLWQTQWQNYPMNRAQQQFKQEARRLQRANRTPRNWPRPLYRLVFHWLPLLGRGVGWAYAGLERLLKLGPGPLMVLIVGLVALGVISQQHLTWFLEIFQQIRDALGMK